MRIGIPKMINPDAIIIYQEYSEPLVLTIDDQKYLLKWFKENKPDMCKEVFK